MMASTFGGAELKVTFGEFSEAFLVFAVSTSHQHRDSFVFTVKDMTFVVECCIETGSCRA